MAKQTRSPKTNPTTQAAQATAPAKAGTPARYQLTAPYRTTGGATWPKGMVIIAPPEEIAERGIQAEAVAPDG